MLATHLRFAFLGSLVGLVVALMPACQTAKKCGPDSCTGCCSSNDECVAPTDAQCGQLGAACVACGTGKVCTAGVCSGSNAQDDGGTDLTDGGNPDAGPGIPPPCTNDFMCEAGKICIAGDCVAGESCGTDQECQRIEEEARCYEYGPRQCTCDTSTTGGGTCRLRKGPCEECQSDIECGADFLTFEATGAGRCTAFNGDTSGKKYCIYQRIGPTCACGTVNTIIEGHNFCTPANNSCATIGCRTDAQCPSDSVCSINQPDAGADSCGGTCQPRCKWDFVNHQSVPDCRANESCWVDAANLDPQSPHFGSGRCKPICTDNTDCQLSGNNPFGGPGLKCVAEKLSDGSDSPKRCRADGQCMDDAECWDILNIPSTEPYAGYCDRHTLTCKSDCRTEADPTTSKPFKDCRPGYACDSDGTMNICRALSCLELGGAGLACRVGQYCCGEDKNFDGFPDPCPAPSVQNEIGCYDIPKPPFCARCWAAEPLKAGIDGGTQAAANAECEAMMAASWATCTNGSKSPNCSPLKPVCQYAGDKGMDPGINVCVLPSVNDVGLVPVNGFSTPKTQITCPVGFTTEFVLPQPNGLQDVGYCQTNADCGLLPDGGNSGMGLCEIDVRDPATRLSDGGVLKACRCTAKSGGAQCPNGKAPVGEVRSFCKDGVAGAKVNCITTAVCSPPRDFIYKATAANGCGL